MVLPGYQVSGSHRPTFFSRPFGAGCGTENTFLKRFVTLVEALLARCEVRELCIHLLPDARIRSGPHWEGQEEGY